MIAPLARFMDWSTLQLASVFAPVREAPESKWRLAEAVEFLNGPDAFPAVSDPARVHFDGRTRFTFPTPRPCEDGQNNIVYGRLFRCATRWRQRPVVVLLDGAPSVGYHTALPWIARRLNRAGFNAALLVAPYQLKRRPRRPIEEIGVHFAHAMAQYVAEVRALIGWLLDQSCPSAGLVGVSFGGWAAGLTACSDARIACAVLTLPRVRVSFSPPFAWRRAREALHALRPAMAAMDTTRLNLISCTPLIPKGNILLIEGVHDLLADPKAVEEVWQNWQQPEIWRLPCGHVSAPWDLTDRVLRWMTPRLDQPSGPGPGTPPDHALNQTGRAQRSSSFE